MAFHEGYTERREKLLLPQCDAHFFLLEKYPSFRMMYGGRDNPPIVSGYLPFEFEGSARVAEPAASARLARLHEFLR